MSSVDPMGALMRQDSTAPAAQGTATRATPFVRPERTPEADARNRARGHSDERLGACWKVAVRARRDARKAGDADREGYWEVFLRALAEEAAGRDPSDPRAVWGDELLEAREAVREGRDPLATG